MVCWSISSSMLGVSSAMIAAVARPALATSSNTATAVVAGGGSGRSRSRAIVTMPSVPSLPTIIPARS